MRSDKHLAIYGNIRISRCYCHACQSYTLILDGEKACCGGDFNEEGIKRLKRMTLAEASRHGPSKKIRQKILEEQEHRCFYCNRPFGSYVYRKNKPFRLAIEFDHVVPYSYVESRREFNFVAACHICNGLKTDKMFKTLEEAQIYLCSAWEGRGYQ